jgi:hypothetical protein
MTLTLWRMRARLLWYWGMAAVRATPPARLPIVAFRHVERIARSRRLGRAADETVEEYLTRLGRVCAGQESECRILGRAFNLVRYGGKTIDEKQAGAVSRAFHAIAAAVISY